MSERVYIPIKVILITHLSDMLAPKPSTRKMTFMLSCESWNIQEHEYRAEWVIFKQIHLWKERGPKRKKKSARNSQQRKHSQKSEKPNIQSIMYEEIN